MKRTWASLLFFLFAVSPAFAAAPIAIHVEAYPDGLSVLTLRANTARWLNLVYAAPGRHQAYFPGFMPTSINGVAWYPTWPDAPDPRPGAYAYENRDCNCNSDTFAGVSPMVPQQNMFVELQVHTAPGPVAIVEWPSAANSYAISVQLDDQYPAGPNYYDLTILITPDPLSVVSLNIRPGSGQNNINARSKGTIQVAILSSVLFDAAKVNATSLTFGRAGDERSLDRCLNPPQDVNKDGLPDLVCHFDTQQSGFTVADTVGILKGYTLDGHFFTGSDSIRIVP